MVQDLDGIQIGEKQLAANKSFIDGVLNELHSMCEHAGFFASPVTGVNLQNGFLRISKTGERKLVAHKPSHARRHTIDAIWDEGQTYTVDGNLKNCWTVGLALATNQKNKALSFPDYWCCVRITGNITR